MKQRISGAEGSIGEEDRQRIATALDAVLSSLGPLDEEICPALILVLPCFTNIFCHVCFCLQVCLFFPPAPRPTAACGQ